MSAKQLIELAKSKGYSVGRLYARNYYVNWDTDSEKFVGAWHEFVKHVRGLPNRFPVKSKS